MTQVLAIRPQITELNRPFWDSCRNGVLVLQRCAECGHLRYPISPMCPACWGFGFEWAPLSGRGVVRSSITFRHAYNDAWRAEIPYVVALVDLAEGPAMLIDIVGSERFRVRVGAPVTVRFDPVSDELTVPHFVLATREEPESN